MAALRDEAEFRAFSTDGRFHYLENEAKSNMAEMQTFEARQKKPLEVYESEPSPWVLASTDERPTADAGRMVPIDKPAIAKMPTQDQFRVKGRPISLAPKV